MVIKHNIPALNARRNIGANNNSVSKNLEKLSSGFRINRSADDAAGLAISEKMRGQIRGTMMGTQNVDMGVNLVQTAEGGLNEIHDILQRMRELAVQSSNGTYQDDDRAQIDKEYQALKSEIDRMAESTHYNGIHLLNIEGTGRVPIYETETRPVEDAIMNQIQASVSTPPVDDNGRFAFFTSNTAGDRYTLQCGGTFAFSQPAIRVNGQEYSLWNSSDRFGRPMLELDQSTTYDGSGTWSTSFKLPDSSGVDLTVVQKVSVVSNPGGIGGESYKIDYEVVNNDPANPVTFDLMYHMDASPNFPYTVGGENVGLNTSYPRDGSIPGQIEIYSSSEPYVNPIISVNSGSGFAFTPGSEPDKVHLGNWNNTSIFGDLGGGTIGENGYAVIWENRTVNNTTPSMSMTTYYGVKNPPPESLGTGTIDVEVLVGYRETSPELWIQSGANVGDGMYVNLCDARCPALGVDHTAVDPFELANEAIDYIDNATNIVSSYRSGFGAAQNRLESTERNNGVKAENLQAAESSIRDVDMAKEMMEFTKNNILIQASQSMLAQANQIPQGILELLR